MKIVEDSPPILTALDRPNSYIGRSVPRPNMTRLLQGRAQYITDVTLPRMAHVAFVRSPHAHAKIVSVNTAAASASPGVIAIFTEADLAADGLGTMRVALPRKRPDGSPLFYVPHPGLARGHVRYVGDPVAMVVAETLRLRISPPYGSSKTSSMVKAMVPEKSVSTQIYGLMPPRMVRSKRLSGPPGMPVLMLANGMTPG